MKDLTDNTEIQEVLDKLENLDDEALGVELLKEFNDKTKVLGQLIMNTDKTIPLEEWKDLCDKAKKDVDEILNKIKEL